MFSHLEFEDSVIVIGKCNKPGTKGNLRGSMGLAIPSWRRQSRGFTPATSTFTKISSSLGSGIGTSTCCFATTNKFRFSSRCLGC